MERRDWFMTAATGFQRVVAGLDPSALGGPGLGDWDVRALLGHSCRAFLTLETYLAAGRDTHPSVVLHSPAEYFRAASGGLGDPAQVTQRGRDAGAALGDDPLSAAASIALRVTDLVSRTPDDAVVASPVGGMRLIDYLPTRAFELTVHGLDLAGATNQPVPAELLPAVRPAIELCCELADENSQVSILLTLTGRPPLYDRLSVI